MAQTRINPWAAALAVLLVTAGVLLATREAARSCTPAYTWSAVPMDGHRVAAQPVNTGNVDQALGVFDATGYTAPSGVRYPEDSPVPAVAQILLAAQPQMAPLKEVVGHSEAALLNLRTSPDLPLANLFVDALRAYASRYFKVPMDFALTNFGGIRCPLPEGAITMEDIASMFPFKNYLCWCRIKGSGLQKLLEQLAAMPSFQATSGATVRVKAHQLESALIGGKPIDPERVYNVATIDFLLDGGDKLNVGALSESVVLSPVLLRDVMLDYVRGCEARGELVRGKADGRVIMED